MKKGFTLMELLAVIVIIALISLLSIIGVSNIVYKSKDDLYNNQLVLIEKAARNWGAENIDKLPNEDECLYLTLSSLKIYGLLDDNILDPRTNDKIPDTMKIKISGELNTYDKLVINYEVDADDLDNCKYIYGDYTLIEGDSFNRRIKNYINGEETNLDTKIKSIVFLKIGELPAGMTEEELTSNNSIDVSVNRDASVLGYFINDTVYIYSRGDNAVSEGILQANAVSDRMFYGMTALETIDFGTLGTENIVSMASMFEDCYSLKYLDLSSFDTSSVLKMNNLFKDCSNLEALNINNFVVNRVLTPNGDYTDMFSGCNNLEITISPDIKTFINARLLDAEVEATLIVK